MSLPQMVLRVVRMSAWPGPGWSGYGMVVIPTAPSAVFTQVFELGMVGLQRDFDGALRTLPAGKPGVQVELRQKFRRAASGRRRSRPKARGGILTPGGAWR